MSSQSDNSANTHSSQQQLASYQDTLANEDPLDGGVIEASLEKQHSGDTFQVVFDQNDPNNPKNWGRLRRWFITLCCSLLVLNSTFASSSPSGILEPVKAHFHFSTEVGALTISLFVAGYCIGPLLWGPLSEQYGRRPVFILTFFCYTCFQIGAALSPNTAALLVFRFLGGAFASCPLTNSGAVIADIWDAKTRGKALALFCIAPFAGPAFGPFIAGYIAVGGASWRWLYWTLALFAGLCWFIILFFIPETYAPIILVKKARKTRKDTGDTRYYAPLEKMDIPFTTQVRNIVAKPFLIMFREPMLIAINMYMAFTYGCVYLLFEAYPVVFQVGHGMNPGAAGLMFIPIFVGASAAVLWFILVLEPRYMKKIEEHKPNPVPPEARLPIVVWSGPLYVISFFWFGWTSYPSISYWAPMMSGLFTGAAILMIFMGLINYIIDAYLFASASALASSTVIRSLAGAGFPLFAGQMYTKLNPRWASTLLGLLALLLAPIPLVLTRFGPELRRRSKYAPTY